MVLHDKNGDYSKYEAVAICSILENTTSAVTFFILHDDTLTYAIRERFQGLVQKYHQSIFFLQVSIDEYRYHENMTGAFSIGTLFRLSIIELLPLYIEKVIYLDADVIANLDIQELWDVDIDEYFVAAVVDEGLVENDVHPWPCKAGLLSCGEYFNGGVLVLNLNFIRENMDLKQEALNFLLKNPQCKLLDQDAMNILFKGKVKYLPKQYNLFSMFVRSNNKKRCKAIIHVAGDYINLEEATWIDELFVKYWLMTPWGTGKDVISYSRKFISLKIRQNHAMQVLLERITKDKCKVVVWGANSVMNQEIRKFIYLKEGRDYYVDNNQSVQGTKVDGISVYSPKVLMKERKKQIVIIVSSQKNYSQIKNELLNFNFFENENFIDGRLLLTQNQGGYIGYF